MLITLDEYEKFLFPKEKLYRQIIGYDISVRSIKRIESVEFIGTISKDRPTFINEKCYQEVEVFKNSYYYLHKGVYSFCFEQGISLDSSHYAEFNLRSSLVRMGGFISYGIYEPGYSTDSIGLVINLFNPVEIEVGSRVAQIKIYNCKPGESYNGQWSKKDIK